MIQTEGLNLPAVVLAPDREGLREIFGIPAVQRIVTLVRRIGCDNIHLCSRPDDVDVFRPLLSPSPQELKIHPAADLTSLRNILEEIAVPSQKRILLVRANTVLDRNTLELYASPQSGALPKSGVDGAGICIVSAESLIPVASSMWVAQLPGAFTRQAGAGLPCLASGPAGAGKAEGRLMETLGLQTRESDGFLARHISRRVSRPLSRMLAHTPVTPNQVTVFNTILGLLAAYMLARGDYWSQLAGSLLFVFCVIADGIDGEIARLKLMESDFGHMLDVVTDNIVHFAIFLGLGVGLYRSSGDPLYTGLLWLLVGGFLINIIIIYFRILKKSPEELRQSPRSVRLMALMSNRDFAYLVLALALIGQLQLFLIGAAIGSYVFAAALLYFTREK